MSDTKPICPLCGDDSRLAWRYKDFTIFECPNCALHFVYPLQSASLKYYRSHYGEIIDSTLDGDIHPGFRYTLGVIQRAVQRYLMPNQRKAIDVGCGPGYVLSELTKWGFDCLGIDFNPEVIRVAVEHYHLNAQVSKVEDLVAVNSRFDLAVLIHTLEHVQDPMKLLRDIRCILNPNGILIVDLPNRDRFTIGRSLRKGTLLPGDYPPHHLTFWSTTSLKHALKLSGYSVHECYPRPLGEEGQVALFFNHRFKLPPSKWLENPVIAIARFARLQGETIFAVARPAG